MSEKLYWHFLPDDGKLANGDSRQVKVGEMLRIEGEPALCEHGFNASERIIDALQYAPGALLCRVRLGGKVIEEEDKVVAQERTVEWMIDVTRVLHEFAIWCAKQALKLVGEPDPRSLEALKVKRLWLDGEATDDELKAAWAASDAASDVVRAAAWAAARAASDAAWAARAAASDAAWAASDAAWAASDAALAARAAAMAAAWAAQDAKLEEMVIAAREKEVKS